jgi:Raf kinase inhibitor-like YbhB/YbcL family protein
MRSVRLFTVLTAMLAVAVGIAAQAPPGQGGGGARGPAAPPFTMTMSFPDGAQLPQKNSALGAMLSPEINWTNAPKTTVSFVLSMDDNDFSRNKTTEGMLHWFVWNIPGTATGLPEGVPMGQLSNGAYQISASGQMYRAPAGPGRQHHYVFWLLALDTKIDVQPGDPFDTRAAVMKALQGHIVGRSTYVTVFGPNDVQVAPIPAK